MEQIGAMALPVIIGLIVLFGFLRNVEVFSVFTSGAKEGVTATLNILPTLIGLIVAVSMLRASGFLEVLSELLRPVTQLFGVSAELAPLAILRPISGSGASAYTLSILKEFGPDSETGKIASVLASSTETTFYAIAVYFGAVGQKKLRYTVPAALLGDCTALVLAVLSVKLFG